jgi:2-keto-4-pentenoate hydratase
MIANFGIGTLADTRIAAGMPTQLDLRRRAIAAGARPIGWKVGFGAPAALTKFAISGPLLGFMLDRNVLAPGATVSLAGWVKPAAEPEIAVEIAADLAGGGSRAAAADAIGGIGPAIELADVTFAPEDVEAILAGNIFHRHVLFGPRDHARQGGRTDGLRARVARNGATHADTTELEANTGKLVDIVRHVADVLAVCGERLTAGDVIIAGSVIAPIFLGPDDRTLDYALDPIGSVAVRFSAG